MTNCYYEIKINGKSDNVVLEKLDALRTANLLRIMHKDWDVELVEAESDLWKLDISVRNHNCLMRAGVTTISYLREVIDQLETVRNLGKRGANEVRQKLEAYDNEGVEK